MDKNQAIWLLDETFNNDFDINRFSKFIKELFNNFEIVSRSWTVWEAFQEYIESFQLLGSYEDNSKKIIDVLAVKLRRTGSVDRARTMQRNFIAKWLANAEKDAALVAFYGDDPQDWRFSFVKMEYQLVKEIDGKVKIAKELTPAKRYSFLVGVNEPNHTCKSQFVNLLEQEEFNPSIEQIEAAFSIDKVTKEFFIEYKELYLKLKEAVEKFIKEDKNIREEFEEKAISTVDFTKKLMGQIVFIYFLQKKGWLGVEKDKGKFKEWGTGPKNFLRKLFEKKNYENFFNDVLEPLFYEALATERDDDYYRLFECKIPFLNGGLFEPMNEYNWRETDLLLGNSIFSEILDTFDQYNFTVKEDEPLEKEVAIDPEMLGKVFENLIEENIRKGQGAYYTPREIVHYMCQQSLINYLETNSGIAKEDIETFIQLGDFAIDEEQKILIELEKKHRKYREGIINKTTYEKESQEILNNSPLPSSIRENYVKIDELLKNIKIVDPAVGSGAFPVGMMNEIVKARSILSIFFSDEEQKKRTNYNLKREIIENCLYGVDIDSSAVDIAKLRFWLSLIVDEKGYENIQPLPNLDHKIMCGNSLLEEFEGHKLFDDKLLGEVKKDYSFEIKQIDAEIAKLNQEKGEAARGKNDKSIKDIDKEINNLIKKKQKILSAPKSDERNATFEEIVDKKIKESQKKLKELKELQHKFFNEQNRKLKKQYRDDIEKIEWKLIEATLEEQGNKEAMKKLQKYKKDKSKPFFLWKLYFAEIFQRQKPGFDVVIGNPPYIDSENMVKNQPEVREAIIKQYTLTKGNWDIYIAFLEKGFSLLNMSGTLTFITPDKWISKPFGDELRKNLIGNIQIIVRAGREVFESALVDSIISFFTKKEHEKIKILLFEKGKFIFRKDIEKKILKSPYQLDYLFSDYFKLLLSIDNKCEKTLSSFGICENACATSDAYKIEPLIHELGNRKFDNQKFLKIVNTGTIGRYLPKWGRKEMIYLGKKYLQPVVDKKEFLDLFNNSYSKKAVKSKIIIKGLNLLDACIDSTGEIIPGKSTLLLPSSKVLKLKFILAIINSKLPSIYLKEKFPSYSYNQGTSYTKNMINQFPIKEVSPEKEKAFILLIDQILSITREPDYLDNPEKQSKVKKLEKEIDQLVYKLYELTPGEIKIVEEFGK